MAKNLSDIYTEKSCEAMTMAIEIYNKPLVKYRADTSIILIINAWELILKATIQKRKLAKLYDKKSNWYKPFLECLECVNANIALDQGAYESIKILYLERCKVIHSNKAFELLDYMAIQSNIIYYKDYLQENFSKDLIKDKTWYILPVGSELPYTKLDFLTTNSALKNSSADIKYYFQQIVQIQNDLVSKGGKGILVEVDVNLTNVKKMKNADVKVGISKDSDTYLSLETKFKLAEEGKPVVISLEELNSVSKEYPLSYAEVLKACRDKGKIESKKFNSFMKKCKKDINLSINWKEAAEKMEIPFTPPDRFIYKAKVVDEYLKMSGK